MQNLVLSQSNGDDKDKILKRVIKISKLAYNYRSTEENELYMKFLSNFEIFQKKVPKHQVNQVLKVSTQNLKYMKIPAGQFLYHIDEPADCIFFVISGEAWRFRPKTDEELKLEAKLINSNQRPAEPKILQTINLARASKARERPFPHLRIQTKFSVPSVQKTQSPLVRKNSSNLAKGGSSRRESFHLENNGFDEDKQNSPLKLSGFFQIKKQSSKLDSHEKSTFKRFDDSAKNSPLIKPRRKNTAVDESNPISFRKNSQSVKELQFIKKASSSSKDGSSPITPKLKPLESTSSHRKSFFGEDYLNLEKNYKKSPSIHESEQPEQSHYDPKMKFRNVVLSKITQNRDVLNFEDDYFVNLVKGNSELARKYIRDKIVRMRFERKILPNEILGEMSMSLAMVRTSSVLAYTDLHVLMLDQKGYEIVFARQLEEVQEKLNFFLDYFAGMKYEILKKVCFFFEEKRFKINEILYREDNPVDGLYFIKSGELHLIKTLPNEDFGLVDVLMKRQRHLKSTPNVKEILIASVVEGHFFGEEALFKLGKRSYSAKAHTNLVCYKLSNELIQKLPKEILEKLYNLALSKRAWREKYIEELVLKNSPRRLANLEFKQKVAPKIITVVGDSDIRKLVPKRKILEIPSNSNPFNNTKRIISEEQVDDYGFEPSIEKEHMRNYRSRLSIKNSCEESSPYAHQLDLLDDSSILGPLSVWKRNVTPQFDKSLDLTPRMSHMGSLTSRSKSKEGPHGKVLNASLNLPPTESKKFQLTMYKTRSENPTPDLKGFLIQSYREKRHTFSPLNISEKKIIQTTRNSLRIHRDALYSSFYPISSARENSSVPYLKLDCEER